MGYLLDTNVSIWLDRSLQRIPLRVLSLLLEPGATLYVSAISFWEIAIKQTAGKLGDDVSLERVRLAYELEELPVTSKYTQVLRALPLLHKDPFDRMLVAQALVEGLVLVTSDRRLADNGAQVQQVT